MLSEWLNKELPQSEIKPRVCDINCEPNSDSVPPQAAAYPGSYASFIDTGTINFTSVKVTLGAN